ncbi:MULTISPECIES: hypothetical protein [Clostridium]|uniref:hypothetical protein n=1 Tax=Clostridium TaxID=1485 RepID=UPI00098CE862|nr:MULTISPECIES: hypothetical protein [Clostridium]NRT80481.1 magnesium-transporting ATPase (P-type) [Clostridium beijerinckii]OOM42297.1 hypothetical protein CBEIJ_43480 [Clostridium beijerinckii]
MIGIVIVTLIIGILIILPFVMSCRAKYEDIPKLINLIIKEDTIIFPIGILMLCYEIYKSGQWEFSPRTDSYIVVFWYIINIIFTFIIRFLWIRGRRSERNLLFLYQALIFTPVITIVFFLIMLFNA